MFIWKYHDKIKSWNKDQLNLFLRTYTNLLYYLGNRCNKFHGQLLRSARNGHYSCNQIEISYRFDDYSILFLHIRLPLNNDMILLRFTWLKNDWLPICPSSLKCRSFWFYSYNMELEVPFGSEVATKWNAPGSHSFLE